MRRLLLAVLLVAAARARACAPDAFTLCLLDRFRIRAEDRAGGEHVPALVGARGARAGTFGLYAADYWDVLVSVADNCRATKTFIIRYVSMNSDPYDLTVTDEHTGIARTFSKTGPPADPFRYDNTTFRCR